MLNKTISVIIPLYNKRDTIIETVKSVVNQTRAADEIIVIDDGSSDGGAECLRNYFGEQVKVISQMNSGVSSARNNGVREAVSEYIAFLDADDLWSPHYLEEVHNLANSFPRCGLIGTRYQYIDAGGQFSNPKIRFGSHYCHYGILESYFAIAAQGDLPFNSSTVTLKKTLLETLKGFPCGEPMGEDQDVWARAALQTDIAYSAKVLGFYNRAAENRACVNSNVAEECPFSKRLNSFAKQCDDVVLANDIVDYTASHLRYLVKKNVSCGSLAKAKKILEDPRCERDFNKKLLIDVLYAKASFIHAIRKVSSICTAFNVEKLYQKLAS